MILGTSEPLTSRQVSTRWPGIAHKSVFGKITMVKGTIIAVTPRVIHVEPKAKMLGFKTGALVPLIGESYLWWCPECKVSHVQWAIDKYCNIEALRQSGLAFEHALGGPRCPTCFKFLEMPHAGQRVLLHYRYAADQQSGTWWAERGDW